MRVAIRIQGQRIAGGVSVHRHWIVGGHLDGLLHSGRIAGCGSEFADALPQHFVLSLDRVELRHDVGVRVVVAEEAPAVQHADDSFQNRRFDLDVTQTCVKQTTLSSVLR